MKKNYLLLALILALILPVKTLATDHTGIISTNKTWTKGNNPHVVTGNVIVNTGITLTIEAGCIVKFNSGTGLVVNGTLIAIGASDDYITFTANDPSPVAADWEKITFNSGSVDALFDASGNYLSGSTLQYCIIEYGDGDEAFYDGVIYGYQAQPFVNNCIIRYNKGFGIAFERIVPDDAAYKTYISYNEIYENGGGIFCMVESYSYKTIIYNNIIVNNNGIGIEAMKWNVQSSTAVRPYSITHNAVCGNSSHGIAIEYTPAILQYNNISDNGSYGLYYRFAYDYTSGYISIEYNTITYNNYGVYIYQNVDDFRLNSSNIYNNKTFNVYNNGTAGVMATSSYWGTTNTSEIDALIYDILDEGTKGQVNYASYASTPLTGWPISAPDMARKQDKGSYIYVKWNAVPHTDVAGYRIYYGAEDGWTYENVINVGNVTSYNLTGASISDNIMVVAYDGGADGNNDLLELQESWFREAEQGLYITHSQVNVSCKNGDNGSINLSTYSGFTPYTYSWSTGETTQDISGLEDGNYTVTVTDAKGFTADASIDITEPPLLEVSLAGTDINCVGGNDGEVDLTITGGTSGYLKSWIGPNEFSSSQEDISGLIEGQYSVTVTDSKGCQASDDITLGYDHELPTPVITYADSNKICDGDSLLLDAGAGYAVYTWSIGASTQTIWVLNDGTYSVTVTDVNGCQNTDAEDLTVYAIPTSSFTASDGLCGPEAGTLTYTGTATVGASYDWMTDEAMVSSGSGQGPIELSWTAPGEKSVSLAVTENGCTSDTTDNIVNVYQIPTSDFILPDAICDSNNVLVSYAGNATAEASYWWDMDDGTTVAGSGQGPIMVKWTSDGIRKVRLAVEENNCLSDTTDHFIDASFPYQDQEICLVTIDLESGKNMVVWENTQDEGIDFFRIWKETNVTNVYEPIGEVEAEDYSQYVDLESEPEQQQNLYKITVVDTCGNESEKSDYHKTLFLQYVSSVGGVNLRWDKYEIEGATIDFDSYIIYRGSDSTKLDSVKTLSGSLNSWTDPEPDVMTYRYYYRIGGVKGELCSPSGNLKAGAGPYSHSLSNLEDNRLQATKNMAPTDISIDISSIQEERPTGTLVGRFTTTDPDEGDTFIYSFVSGEGDDDNSGFTISGDLLLSAVAFDFETQASFTIRVRSTDNGTDNLFFEKAFTITVTDVVETGLPDNVTGGLHIYPNPFSHAVTIEFPNQEGNEYTLFIRDLTGKLIHITAPVNNDKIILERGNLSSGYYIIELRGDKILRGKIIIE